MKLWHVITPIINTNEPGDETGSNLEKRNTNINHSHHVSKGGEKGKISCSQHLCEQKKMAKETTISKLKLRNSHSHSLRIAVADADGDRLDTGLLGGGGGGTVELNQRVSVADH
jgi:hypothetical protein